MLNIAMGTVPSLCEKASGVTEFPFSDCSPEGKGESVGALFWALLSPGKLVEKLDSVLDTKSPRLFVSCPPLRSLL